MSARIEIVTSIERLNQLAAPWTALWERSRGHIFQRHQWLAAWAGAIRREDAVRPLMVLAWREDRLVGVLPCEVERRLGLRLLHWSAQRISDYCDVLVDPDEPLHEMLPFLWRALWKAGGFDLVQLRQVRPDGKARRFLDGLVASRAMRRPPTETDRCMRIDCLWRNGEEFFRSLNKKARNNHTRGKRILSELGGQVEFRRIDGSEPFGPLLDRIFALKEAWMRVHHPDSPLLNRDGVIMRAVLEAAWSAGLLSVFVLEAGGRLAAVSLNFVDDTRLEAYVTTYDPDFDRASPGTILIVEYAMWAFDRGLRQVDFLRGDEAFKLRMANAETTLDGYMGARTLTGHVALMVNDLRLRLSPPVGRGTEGMAASPDVDVLNAPQPSGH